MNTKKRLIHKSLQVKTSFVSLFKCMRQHYLHLAKVLRTTGLHRLAEVFKPYA